MSDMHERSKLTEQIKEEEMIAENSYEEETQEIQEDEVDYGVAEIAESWSIMWQQMEGVVPDNARIEFIKTFIQQSVSPVEDQVDQV